MNSTITGFVGVVRKKHDCYEFRRLSSSTFTGVFHCNWEQRSDTIVTKGYEVYFCFIVRNI